MRRCLKLTGNGRIRTGEMGVECSITKKENMALQWYGHVQRMAEQRWSKYILQWEPPRRRGRPGIRQKLYIGRAMGNSNSNRKMPKKKNTRLLIKI